MLRLIDSTCTGYCIIMTMLVWWEGLRTEREELQDLYFF